MEFTAMQLKCTPTERALIRDELHSGYAKAEFVQNNDGSYVVHIRDVCFEANSTADLLTELVEILRES